MPVEILNKLECGSDGVRVKPVGALFTHEPVGVILKSRFAELSTHYPPFPRQFRKPLPACRCDSATLSWRCRSNTTCSRTCLIPRNQRFRGQLISQSGEFLINSRAFRFESLNCQFDDSTICHISSVNQSAFRAMRVLLVLPTKYANPTRRKPPIPDNGPKNLSPLADPSSE